MHGDSFSRIPPGKIAPGDVVRIAACHLTALLLAVSAGSAASQEVPPETPLTERAAIEYALARPALRAAEAARLDAAQSAVVESGIRPNPVVSVAHERVDAQTGGASESSVLVSQTFEISGRRALRQAAAATRLQAAQLDAQSRQLVTLQDVRRNFAEALYRQQLLTSHADWLRRIESAAAVVNHLASAGEASGYDRRRLEREMQGARARLQAAQADSSRVRELLASLMGRPLHASESLDGDLIPQAPPPLESLVASAERHPEMASLDAQAKAYERDRQAAGQLRTPDVTLGIGGKYVREPGFSDHGLMLSLSVPIPLFDRGQAQEQQARAQAMTLQAERTLKLTRAQGELRGLWQQTTQLRQAAISYRDQTLTASHELSRIAEASYRGGEGSMLELLDAYRAELEAQTMQLDLALRARMARIELDALSGAEQDE